jgi:hypothetical protein
MEEVKIVTMKNRTRWHQEAVAVLDREPLPCPAINNALNRPNRQNYRERINSSS